MPEHTVKTLAAMVRDVARLTNQPIALGVVLQQCCETLVMHLQAAFVRTWIYQPDEQILKLVASAGMYTHLDGAHSRIKFGDLKIGRIASERLPHLTNDVQNDPRISDPRWAKDKGIVSFAGYPLIVEDQLVGVIGLFSKSELGDDALLCLEAIANIIGGLIGRKWHEQEQKKTETLFRDFALHSSDAFWIIDATRGKYEYLSPAFESIFEIPTSELIDDTQAFTRNVLADDLPAVQDFVRRSSCSTDNLEIDFRIRSKAGTTKYIWSRSFPLETEGDHVIRVAGVAHDVTERKLAEQRVRQFYSMISHELRTPLASIKASLSLIEASLVNPEEAMELVGIAHSDCDRLIRLVNDILDLRKTEQGKLDLSIKSVELLRVFQRVSRSLQSLVEEQSGTITVDVDPGLAVEADEDRLTQILINLVGNAIKFSPKGSSVKMSAAVNGNYVRCAITDQGPGINESDQQKLFALFQQLDSSDARTHGGSGLGLAISKALVEAQGGHIGVESEPGRGSMFWFELPLVGSMNDYTEL